MNQKKTNKTSCGIAAALAVLLLTLCIAAAPAAADDAPSLPLQVYGTAVDANGNPLPAGTEITATVDGITSTYVVKEAGKIGGPGTFDEKFLITGKTSGNTVVFAVNGVESGQTAVFASGETVEQPNLAFAVVIGNTGNPETGDGNGNGTDDSGNTGNPETGDGNGNGTGDSGNTGNPETGDGNGNGTDNSGKNGGSSSAPSGSGTAAETQSTQATPKPTAASTTQPTENPTPVVQPTSASVPVKPTEQASTPLPIGGIIAGLLAAGILLRRKL